jgi:drug/metabolite transporter (DMT)-like permease
VRPEAGGRAGRFSAHPSFETALAWYFVLVWGSGYLATKAGIQYAPPFTFLTLRFVLGIAILAPIIAFVKPRWPSGAATPADMPRYCA